MTEIQAIIDKLEAEQSLMLTTYADVNLPEYIRYFQLTLAIEELKKHLPKEDKSSFEVVKYDNRGFPLVEYIKGGPFIENLYILEIEDSNSPNHVVFIAKKDLPTIIAALQAAHEEMEDED